MYRQARLADEIGSGIVRGEDAVTALIAAGIIIGFFLIVGGAAIEIQCSQGALHGNVCNWGEELIIFGGLVVLGFVCVALHGCALIVQNILVMQA